MKINDFFLVNAFTGDNARGNPCAVVMLDDLENSDHLSKLASDFNQPASAFIKQIGQNRYRIRWFAPEAEIDLCGHGAIATTWVLTQHLKSADQVELIYNDGELIGKSTTTEVSILGDVIATRETPIPEHVKNGFHGKAIGYFPSPNKHVVLLENEDDVLHMDPNWEALRQSNTFSYAVTAPSDKHDFVSRVFLPFIDKLEDQATGSAHMVLAPFWSDRLDKSELEAFQCSKRGGRMRCGVEGDAVELIAECEVVAKGTLL